MIQIVNFIYCRCIAAPKKAGWIMLFSFVVIFSQLTAKEGMWLPVFLEKYNLAEMQQMGFKLTAADVYDVNNASMKDAVVIFGGGCTGELISDEGLLITNHHCGYRNIQYHSSVEHDYLTNGFWAMDKSRELPNPGLSVSFLEYMKDVTEEVFKDTAGFNTAGADKKIRENIAGIETEARQKGKYSAQVKPLYYGNQYFLYVYKVYRDVRLVGAPPSSIGKFGGDTDNWMWPRHTGDFSLFRIYAGKDNEPADYSPDNVPFKPKKFFPVSLKGVNEGDFTMVFGNPGTTSQYVPWQEIELVMNQRNPDRIAIRNKKLEIIGDAMEQDAKVRIQYSAKYQGVSNAWKKWQGEIKGLKRMDAVSKKREFENAFISRAKDQGQWENHYKEVFESFKNDYSEYARLSRISDYYNEIVFRGVEIFRMASLVNTALNAADNKQDDRLKMIRENAEKGIEPFFKDFFQPVDEQLFAVLLPMLINDLNQDDLPADFITIVTKYDQNKLIEKIYRKSVLPDQKQLTEILTHGNMKELDRLRKDPLVSLVKMFDYYYELNVRPQLDTLNQRIAANMKKYMAGIMEMKTGQPLYPDANMTLRVTYGLVEGYEPMDGVKYKYFTTLEGIIEKDNPEVYDYDVPDKLKALYKSKDYGLYGTTEGMPVCFVASNHTSGGNSGSPVVNGNGELVGINFDRCWEGTMSDMMFDPEMCRNISLDIRYVLFIIDKFAGADYLLDEMKLVY